MNRLIVLRPEARADLFRICDWYDQQQPGLAEEFATAIATMFARIAEMPELYAMTLRMFAEESCGDFLTSSAIGRFQIKLKCLQSCMAVVTRRFGATESEVM